MSSSKMTMPDRHVTMGAFGGALGVLLVAFILEPLGVEVEAVPAMALQTVIIFGLQYYIGPDKKT